MRSVCQITKWQVNRKFTINEIWSMTKKFETRLTIEPTEAGRDIKQH
jgi:hypothetical protein